MPNSYKQFVPQEILHEFPGASWNSIVEAARWVDKQRALQKNPVVGSIDPQSITVQVRNATDKDFEGQFNIVGLGDSTIDPTAGSSSTGEEYEPVIVDGKAPDEKKHRSTFAVLQMPAAKNEVVAATAFGYTMVKVVVNDVKHRFCGIKSGDVENLHSGRQGAEILWKASQDEGKVWCLVKLLPLPPLYYLNPCDTSEEPLLVSNDLYESIGKVAVVSGVCYKIEVPPPTVDCWSAVCADISKLTDDCNECEDPSSACWLLTPCDAGTALTVKGEFQDYEGKIVWWADSLCYTVSKSTDCDAAQEADVSSIKSSYDDCADCGLCTKLENCVDQSLRYVRTDQIGVDPESLIDLIMRIDGTCYTILDVKHVCSGFPEDLGKEYDGLYYETCGECGCYYFEECSGGGQLWVAEAEWAADNEPFDLSELEIGDVIIAGVSDSVLQCWEFKGVVTDCASLTIAEVWYSLRDYDLECECCNGYKLTECQYAGNDIVWSHNPELCQYVGSGKAIKRFHEDPGKDGKCYEIEEKLITDPAAIWEEFIIESAHDDCTNCLDPRYKLIDAGCKKEVCEKYCDGCGSGDPDCESADPIVTDEDLSDAIGKIVKHNGICWEVEETQDEVTDPAPLDWTGPFPSCEPCLEEPICIEVVEDVWIDAEDKLMKKVKRYIVKANLCDEEDIEIVPVGDCP